jgi:hypothetical protein
MTKMSSQSKRMIRQVCIELQHYTARQIYQTLQDETKQSCDDQTEVQYRRSITLKQVVRYLRMDPESNLIQMGTSKRPTGSEALYHFSGTPSQPPLSVEVSELRERIVKLERNQLALIKHLRSPPGGTK